MKTDVHHISTLMSHIALLGLWCGDAVHCMPVEYICSPLHFAVSLHCFMQVSLISTTYFIVSNVLWRCRDVRTAAAMAMADFGTHPEGREMLRREGAIRPLVLLLGEGIESPAAEQAAKALMTLSASDINKVCICISVFILLYSFRSNIQNEVEQQSLALSGDLAEAVSSISSAVITGCHQAGRSNSSSGGATSGFIGTHLTQRGSLHHQGCAYSSQAQHLWV